MKPIDSWWRWIARRRETDFRPWAIVGKGPSFTRDGVDWSRYQTIGLNHVAREIPVTVAHVIDVEVIEQVPLEHWLRADVVAMPWRPHVDSTVGRPSLADHARECPSLAAIRDAGKLVYYNLAGDGRPADCIKSRGPAVGVRFYSSEAAFNLLAGARATGRISLCGIDGGVKYSEDFHDLRPFANGRQSFDEGIGELIRIARKNHIAVDRLPFADSDPDATLYRDLYLQDLNYGSRNHGRDVEDVLVKQLHAESVLDVGCGDNSFARSLRRRGLIARGVDVASPWADDRCPADALPFTDGAFDWVTSFDALEHIGEDRLPAVLAEFARVAARGWLLKICPRASTTPGPNGETLHRTVRPVEWWREQIERAGMVVVPHDEYLVCVRSAA